MKKRLILMGTIVCAAVSGIIIIPGTVRTSIPTAYYIRPEMKTYENIINCSGYIQSANIYDLHAENPFVPASVEYVSGDMVEVGDILVMVDEAAAKNLSSNISDVIGSMADKITVPEINLDAIISSYGLSSLLGGVDMSGVSEALSVSTQSGGASYVAASAVKNEIRSPASGVITDINITPGSVVSSGAAIMRIQDIQNYYVLVSVNESDISKLKVGDSAIIRGTGFSGVSFQGVVRRISPIAHRPASVTSSESVVDVEIDILNPDDRIKHGFSAKVEINGGEGRKLLTVPYEAIRQDEYNTEFVYTYTDGKIVKTKVVTGSELINEVEILSGIGRDSIVIYNPDDVPGASSIVNIKGRAKVV